MSEENLPWWSTEYALATIGWVSTICASVAFTAFTIKVVFWLWRAP